MSFLSRKKIKIIFKLFVESSKLEDFFKTKFCKNDWTVTNTVSSPKHHFQIVSSDVIHTMIVLRVYFILYRKGLFFFKKYGISKNPKFVNRVLCAWFLFCSVPRSKKIRLPSFGFPSPLLKDIHHGRVEVEGAKKGLRTALSFEITFKRKINKCNYMV